MAEKGEEDESEIEAANESEPERLSWYVYSFMGMCVFMTAAMAYYAWRVFERSF